MASIRIGTGFAWWGDRVEPARLNAERGDLDYLCFETMAEATISAARVRKRRDPEFVGYDTCLDDRMQAVLPGCLKRGTRIVSNQGWINPDGAAERIVHWLREFGGRGVKVAAVTNELYDVLRQQLSAARFKAHYKGVIKGAVQRYGVPGLGALQFVADGALGGGVSRSLCLDNYGKALCSAILAYPIEVPDRLQNQLRGL